MLTDTQESRFECEWFIDLKENIFCYANESRNHEWHQLLKSKAKKTSYKKVSPSIMYGTKKPGNDIQDNGRNLEMSNYKQNLVFVKNVKRKWPDLAFQIFDGISRFDFL